MPVGIYSDAFLEEFKRNFLHEAQQKGSRLLQVCQRDDMNAHKGYFFKMDKADVYEKTSFGETKTFDTPAFEKRPIEYNYFSHDIIVDDQIDKLDLITDPTSDYMKRAIFAHQRKLDDKIYKAIIGSQDVIANGATTSTNVSNSIAVNDSHYGGSGSDVGLTLNKLIQGRRLIIQDYGLDSGEDLIVIAPEAQILNLLIDVEATSRDFRGSQPFEGPGVNDALSGLLGIKFISYEPVSTDSSSDEKAVMLTSNAIKCGFRKDFDAEIIKLGERVGNPDAIGVTADYGLARMFEEKVAIILCDPLA